jgi:hypothetical protein
MPASLTSTAATPTQSCRQQAVQGARVCLTVTVDVTYFSCDMVQDELEPPWGAMLAHGL